MCITWGIKKTTHTHQLNFSCMKKKHTYEASNTIESGNQKVSVLDQQEATMLLQVKVCSIFKVKLDLQTQLYKR